MYGGTHGQGPGPGENLPSWTFLDQQCRDRYLFAGLQGGQRIPRKWLESGAVVTADTIAELAGRIGVDADGLTRTLERFNGFARTGMDEDFHRGESAYNRYYSDPINKPNPNHGELTHPPYHAVKMVPGDLGTKGGVRTDVHARALRDDGSIIAGLYAAGNVSSPVMGHTYPGPGGTIGPAWRSAIWRRCISPSKPRPTEMPIDLDVALGAELEPIEFSWSSRDVQLYHLGLGGGADPMNPRELRYLVDDTPQVLPTFGNVTASFHETEPPKVKFPGIDIELSKVLHASETVTVPAPLPASGSARSVTRFTEVWDKGKAAVIVSETSVTDLDGTPLWSTRRSIFARGEGGFGGERGPSTSVEPPDRAPDVEVPLPILPQQALLYRLCGGRNPLHSDPQFAAAAGFPRPILHGLCTYGLACKAIVDTVLDGDVSRVHSYGARFAGVVYPARHCGPASGRKTTSCWPPSRRPAATMRSCYRVWN